ncbi:uncharacterized protein LOC143922930 [Arctopsyche grandis]|uniref:uncharacterized protein LOC143922930 n=1 Tax=Arctopsyche grandis TaxID=121162 RepID=UPI00406D9232
MANRDGKELNTSTPIEGTTDDNMTQDDEHTDLTTLVSEQAESSVSSRAKHGRAPSITSYDWQQVLGSFRKKLQRHPSSYEREPDDDVTPEQATSKSNNLRLQYLQGDQSQSSRPTKTNEFSSSTRLDAKMSLAVDPRPDNPDEAEKSTTKTRLQRNLPSLSRVPRIESDTEPIEREKILKILKNTVMSVFSDEPKKEGQKTPDEKASDETLDTKSVSDATSPIKMDFNYRRMSRNISEKTISPMHEEKTPDKEVSSTSRAWIPKSVSKILSDNKSSSSEQKKRAKSPSSILEYAQRKLPKWATFSKKSDDDGHELIKTPKIENIYSDVCLPSTSNYREKSESNEELEQPVTVTLNQPSFSDNEDVEKAPKTLCRWFVSDEENPVDADISINEGLKLTKTLSCEPLGAAVKPSLSFFKSKDYNKHAKLKNEPVKSKKKNEKTLVPNPYDWTADQKNCDLKKAKSDAGDYRKLCEVKPKSKFFSKQKSKEKPSTPTGRKNSIKFGNLKSLWFKSSKEKAETKMKAASAEALECGRIRPYPDQEFLMSSVQVFLAVTPAGSKLQVLIKLHMRFILQCAKHVYHSHDVNIYYL